MLNESEKRRFEEIAESFESYDFNGGVGTLSEKRLHFVLKNFISPDRKFHEVKMGRFIVDIFDGTEIIEIQTSNFSYMRKKLDFFLERYPVKIVYPVPVIKNILWIDPESGAVSKKRKSPRSGRASDILKELVYIIGYISSENIKFTLYLIEVDEYRLQNGWGNNGKKGSVRYERIPKKLFDIIELTSKEDYYKIIPFEKGAVITRAEIKESLRMKGRNGDGALKALMKLGIIEKCGTEGRKIIYKVV